MSKEYTDLELAKLTETLKNAFETAVQQDSELLNQVMKASQENAELLADVQSIAMEFMAQAASELLTTPANELEEKLAPDALKVMEKTFEFGVVACGADKIREYIAPANQTQDVAAAFESRELSTLAKLYAPK